MPRIQTRFLGLMGEKKKKKHNLKDPPPQLTEIPFSTAIFLFKPKVLVSRKKISIFGSNEHSSVQKGKKERINNSVT